MASIFDVSIAIFRFVLPGNPTVHKAEIWVRIGNGIASWIDDVLLAFARWIVDVVRYVECHVWDQLVRTLSLSLRLELLRAAVAAATTGA